MEALGIKCVDCCYLECFSSHFMVTVNGTETEELILSSFLIRDKKK